jgi:ribonuclease-3
LQKTGSLNLISSAEESLQTYIIMSKRHHEGSHGGSSLKKHQAQHPRNQALASNGSPQNVPLPSKLPALPVIKTVSLKDAPFRHSSTVHGTRDVQSQSYDQLEFLGDAYLEVFATRLIFHQYSHLPAGQMSQLREQLVKNETLAGYSMAYGFDTKVNISDAERARMKEGSRDRGNKGFNKILGDVWEAYLAAVVLDNPETGEKTAEEWMCELWTPKVLATVKVSHSKNKVITDEVSSPQPVALSGNDPRQVYDSTAKAQLQKRLLGNETRLEYEVYKASKELKGELLGQSRHYIALYFTGFGYERELLGKGEGKNKVEAGNWAALEAMYGEKKTIVDKCVAKLLEAKEARRLRLEAENAVTK